MALTKKEVAHVAKLARLHLAEEEIDRFTIQLESIFQHLDTLSKLDTEGVEETAQVSGLSGVTRPDRVEPSLPREDVLKTSKRPNTKGMISVRKSI